MDILNCHTLYINLMKKLLVITALSLSAFYASAYTERNLISSRVSKDELKEILVQDQKWVKLPAYADRDGWDALLGDYKEKYIRRGGEVSVARLAPHKSYRLSRILQKW